MFGEALMLLNNGFGFISTIVILAVCVTLPIVQFFALGYLLHAAGIYARTGKFSQAFVAVQQYSRVGQFLLGCWLLTLPLRLLVSLRDDAALIAAGSADVAKLNVWAYVVGGIVGWIALMALANGGRFIHFLRPLRSTRQLLKTLRKPTFFDETRQRLKSFVSAFELGHTFSLGVRGYVGAGVWLLVPTTLIAVGRDNVLALIGSALLIAVLMYLPFAQMHFAAEDRFKAIFDLHRVRYLFQRAPMAFWFAFVSTLLLALPLYLLKIEVVPRQALWLPAAVFLFTIFPCKLLTAWAYHRALKRGDEPRHGFWSWLARLFMIPTAVFYAFIVFLTQFTGWHGVLGLYEHHAFLLPVPF